MPNSLNFGDPIPVPYINIRPDRRSQVDRQPIDAGTKQVLFGTDPNDLIEVWVYDSNGAIAGHMNIDPTSDIISLTTVVDNTGSYEMINLDMGKIIRFLNLENGRYGFVANFFRNEVGSESSDHLYIKEISTDRTELKLFPIDETTEISRDIFEWVEPSVPKIDAQALLAQLFDQNELPSVADSLSPGNIEEQLDTDIPFRLQYSGADSNFNQLVTQLINLAYPIVLDNMASDVLNKNVQTVDLAQYISEAIAVVIQQLNSQGSIDPRIEIF